jgi:hypothetical protein
MTLPADGVATAGYSENPEDFLKPAQKFSGASMVLSPESPKRSKTTTAEKLRNLRDLCKPMAQKSSGTSTRMSPDLVDGSQANCLEKSCLDFTI